MIRLASSVNVMSDPNSSCLRAVLGAPMTHPTKYRDDFDGMNRKIDLLASSVELIQSNVQSLQDSHIALVKRLGG